MAKSKVYGGIKGKALNQKAGSGSRPKDTDYEHRKQAYGEPTVKGRKTPVPEVSDSQGLTAGSPGEGWI